jgi:hypothetical protein
MLGYSYRMGFDLHKTDTETDVHHSYHPFFKRNLNWFVVEQSGANPVFEAAWMLRQYAVSVRDSTDGWLVLRYARQLVLDGGHSKGYSI